MTRKAIETLIGVNQALGGVLILTSQASAVRHGIVALPTRYFYLAMGVAGVSMWVGWLLVRGKRLGRQLSIVLQGLQVFGVASRMFSWRFELGLKATVELTSSSVMTHWGFGGVSGGWPWPAPSEPTFVFNPLALIALIYLVRQSRQES